MTRSSRKSPPVRSTTERLLGLERALRGADPDLSPEWAAEALAKSRAGRSLLIEVIASRERPHLRQAAVYGFVFGPLEGFEFNFLLRKFVDPSEDPGVRGQVAEALGPRVAFSGHLRRRDWVPQAAFERGLDDQAPVVRFWSIFALANPGNDSLVPKLQTMVEDRSFIPRMWTVGQEASWAIHWIHGEDVDPQEL